MDCAACFYVRSLAGQLDLGDLLALVWDFVLRELVTSAMTLLVAVDLRLELGDIEDCLAPVTFALVCTRYAAACGVASVAPLCTRYAAACDVCSSRAGTYMVRIGLRGGFGTLLGTRYPSAVACLYAWLRRCVQGALRLATSSSRKAYLLC